MAVVDVTQNLLVRLALGQAQIDKIIVTVRDPITLATTGLYNVYPIGELPIAYEGESVTIELFITNIGDDATIFVQVSSPEVSPVNPITLTNYLDAFLVSGELMTPIVHQSWFSFTMPATDVNLIIEAGHI